MDTTFFYLSHCSPFYYTLLIKLLHYVELTDANFLFILFILFYYFILLLCLVCAGQCCCDIQISLTVNKVFRIHIFPM